MNRTIHICSFTTGLDDMKCKDQADPVKVLEVLQGQQRFSCFEASANRSIAKTMTLLSERGLIKTTPLGYPWSKVEITEVGRGVLAGDPIPPKPDPFEGMVQIGKRTYITQKMYEEKFKKMLGRDK